MLTLLITYKNPKTSYLALPTVTERHIARFSNYLNLSIMYDYKAQTVYGRPA